MANNNNNNNLKARVNEGKQEEDRAAAGGDHWDQIISASFPIDLCLRVVGDGDLQLEDCRCSGRVVTGAVPSSTSAVCRRFNEPASLP